MKGKNTKTILIVVVLAILAGVYFYSPGDLKIGNLFQGDRGTNGYWNAEAQECWTTPTALSGGKQEGNLVSCCFDAAGYQVDCTDASKKLSNSQLIFAVYQPEGTTATPGLFFVAHTISIANTGSVPLDNVWVDSATWASVPSNTAGNVLLTANYSRIVGPATSYAGAIAVGGPAKQFPTQLIDLQKLDTTGTGTTYTLNLNAKATAYDGSLTSSIPLVKTMKVTREAIGFSVDIVWA